MGHESPYQRNLRIRFSAAARCPKYFGAQRPLLVCVTTPKGEHPLKQRACFINCTIKLAQVPNFDRGKIFGPHADTPNALSIRRRGGRLLAHRDARLRASAVQVVYGATARLSIPELNTPRP